jgi:nitrogen fixation protein NifX
MALQRRMRVVDDSTGADAPTTAIKVAFATTDMSSVDQHFGSARSFAIYAVDMDQVKLLEASQFGQLSQDGNEDKLAIKLDVLSDCAAVYCNAVGSSAARQLLSRGIQPMKVTPGAEIADLLEALQDELRSGPSAWLAKAIKQQSGGDTTRFDTMEEEGWEE